MPVIPPTSSIPPLQLGLLQQPAKPAAPSGDGQTGFGKAITDAVGHLVQVQGTADAYSRQAATGELQSVQDYMVAATEAQLTTQLTIAVRNKAVEAYQEIMRMQV